MIDMDYEGWEGTPRVVHTWRAGMWQKAVAVDIGRAVKPVAVEPDRELAVETLPDGIPCSVRIRSGATPIWLRIKRLLEDEPDGATIERMAATLTLTHTAVSSCVSGYPRFFEYREIPPKFSPGRKGRPTRIVTLRKESE